MSSGYCHNLFPEPRSTLPSPRDLARLVEALFKQGLLPSGSERPPVGQWVDPGEIEGVEGRVFRDCSILLPREIESREVALPSKESWNGGRGLAAWPFIESPSFDDFVVFSLRMYWFRGWHVDSQLTVIEVEEHGLGENGELEGCLARLTSAFRASQGARVRRSDRHLRVPCDCGANVLVGSDFSEIGAGLESIESTCPSCGTAFDPSRSTYPVRHNEGWGSTPLMGGTFFRFRLEWAMASVVPGPPGSFWHLKPEIVHACEECLRCSVVEFPCYE